MTIEVREVTEFDRRQMLRTHMAEFRSAILGELTEDEIVLLLTDCMEFGWIVRKKVDQWIDEYFDAAREAYIEEARMRAAHDKERI